MISRLNGKVIDIDLHGYILDVNGVGYRINCTEFDLKKIRLDQDLIVNTFLDVKEKSLELYGFINKEDQTVFELLLNVSGIGPKKSLGILNTTNSNTLLEGIGSGDANHLSQISGISKKQSEKIVIALRDKVEGISIDENIKSGTNDIIEALQSLGYSPKESREAIKQIDKNLKPEEMIKVALKNLNK